MGLGGLWKARDALTFVSLPRPIPSSFLFQFHFPPLSLPRIVILFPYYFNLGTERRSMEALITATRDYLSLSSPFWLGPS